MFLIPCSRGTHFARVVGKKVIPAWPEKVFCYQSILNAV